MSEPAAKPNHVRTLALTVIVLAAMALLFAGYFLKRAADAPGDFSDQVPIVIEDTARAAADGLKKLAAAINTRTITLEFTSTATTLEGTARLQVATIRQVELFERRDSPKLWVVPLPEVIVSARAPIEYTYYLDLTGAWEFYLDASQLYVVAPPIEFNKPAVDASAIAYTVQKGSVIRDHDAAINELKLSITAESYKRARDNIQLARESARRQAAWFVQRFIGQAYDVDTDFPVTIVFRDETPPASLQDLSSQGEATTGQD